MRERRERGNLEVRKRPREGGETEILEKLSLCFLWCHLHPVLLPFPCICPEPDMITQRTLRQAASVSQL